MHSNVDVSDDDFFQPLAAAGAVGMQTFTDKLATGIVADMATKYQELLLRHSRADSIGSADLAGLLHIGSGDFLSNDAIERSAISDPRTFVMILEIIQSVLFCLSDAERVLVRFASFVHKEIVPGARGADLAAFFVAVRS